MSEPNQAKLNRIEFDKFVNAFFAQGLNPGEAPTVFHVMLRARGHKVVLTIAPGELIVSVRAVATKPTFVQRIKKLFT